MPRRAFHVQLVFLGARSNKLDGVGVIWIFRDGFEGHCGLRCNGCQSLCVDLVGGVGFSVARLCLHGCWHAGFRHQCLLSQCVP